MFVCILMFTFTFIHKYTYTHICVCMGRHIGMCSDHQGVRVSEEARSLPWPTTARTLWLQCPGCQEELLTWSQEPWQKARCSVDQAGTCPKSVSLKAEEGSLPAQQLCKVGIAYSGDCNLPRDEEEAYDYGAWPPATQQN